MTEELLEEIAAGARERHIPIVRPETGKALVEAATRAKPKNILEIGTAVGYSGILMLNACGGGFLDTVDVDERMCAEAVKNFERAGFSERVRCHCCDAGEFLKNAEGEYDFVFLDGAKSRYKEYFFLIDKLLKRDGVIFADNVLYLGLVKGDDYPPHKHRTIVNAMREYIEFMKNNERYAFEVFDVEDGYSVARKRG